jgi:hypothetical protein
MNADALKQLRQTHAAGCQLLQRFNYKPESIGVAIEVEKNGSSGKLSSERRI